MTLKKRFRIVAGPLSIRTEPHLGAPRLGELPVGVDIDVDADSRREADGFIWWYHANGWSAERRLDNRFVFMQAFVDLTPAPDAAETLSFVVVNGPVSVRARPTVSALRRGEVANGVVIKVQADSRTVADGYIWWQHAQGWSAERTLDSRYVIMRPAPPETPPVGTPPPEDTGTRPPIPTPAPVEPPGTPRYFRVTAPRVNVRALPALAAARVGELLSGNEISTTLGERTEADGHVWWRHARGWSAERTLDNRVIYLESITALSPQQPVLQPDGRTVLLPDGKTFEIQEFFQRSPMDFSAIQWIQYYGNTQFAQRIWAEGKQWYRYSQGLHGGFDYGNAIFGTPLYAGVHGNVTAIYRNSLTYAPNYIEISVGSYVSVIYGHITNLPDLQPGYRVVPNTIIGYVDAGGQNHLHLEVRYRGLWILNPLLLMNAAVRDPILTRFLSYDEHFYRDNTWNQWLSPFDQPVLKLGGPIIGPHNRS